MISETETWDRLLHQMKNWPGYWHDRLTVRAPKLAEWLWVGYTQGLLVGQHGERP